MEPKNVLLNDYFRKSIVCEGLFALCEGEFDEWITYYSLRDKFYAPGELEYVSHFKKYVRGWRAKGGVLFNPFLPENERRLEQMVSEVGRNNFLNNFTG
jgi:hypothetical protein